MLEEQGGNPARRNHGQFAAESVSFRWDRLADFQPSPAGVTFPREWLSAHHGSATAIRALGLPGPALG